MGVWLALDPGARRTGIAISDPAGILASPLGAHDRRRDGSILDRVESLCIEHHVTRVLVGHPLTAAGEQGESARRSERIAELLRARLDPHEIEVVLVDERYSTAEAQKILRGRPHARDDRDALAAALVLQACLDARRPEGDLPR